MSVKIRLLVTSSVLFFVACSSNYLKLDKKEEDFKKNVEFEEKVVIKEIAEGGPPAGTSPIALTPDSAPTPTIPMGASSVGTSANLDVNKKQSKETKSSSSTKGKKKQKGKGTAKLKEKVEVSLAPTEISEPVKIVIKREPDIEDDEGFVGRRPIADPFRVGEEVVHDVHYFKVSAGELFLKVDPFVEVNGKKAYTFTTMIKSSSMFSTFYSADDKATTYVDFYDLVPHVFILAVKESGQLRDAKGLIDLQKNMATYWEKKFTKKNGQEERKLEWEVLPFSQNVYSAAYYMRLFKWEVGKEYAFRVADQGENLVFKGKAIRKEKLETEVGEFNTIVIKPEITVKGVFRPIGDIFFWLSDDDRKFVLRIESNIKIGTIVSEVIRLNKGH